MARIAGVDIPKDKKVAYSLRYVHGIGLKTALDICEQAKVDPNTRVTDLSSKLSKLQLTLHKNSIYSVSSTLNNLTVGGVNG